jgi:hypothetical protein
MYNLDMNLTVGKIVWLPCEVKPGPFSDERLVRVSSDRGEWVGFVPVSSLREPVPLGPTFVRAVVTEIHDDRFSARLPGHAVTPIPFEGVTSRAVRIGALQA